MLDRFEPKHIEEYLKELDMLQHMSTMDAHMEKFQIITVFVPNMEDGRLVYLFMDGLEETIRSLVKATKPSILSIAILKAKLLEGFNYPKGVVTKNPMISMQATVIYKDPIRGKPPLAAPKPTNRLDYATREALRKQKLHFTFQNPSKRGHRCNRKA